MAKWCEKCARFDGTCKILFGTLTYSIDDPEYPKEWVRDAYHVNERCTAFVPEGEEIPPDRCEKTLDLFNL